VSKEIYEFQALNRMGEEQRGRVPARSHESAERKVSDMGFTCVRLWPQNDTSFLLDREYGGATVPASLQLRRQDGTRCEFGKSRAVAWATAGLFLVIAAACLTLPHVAVQALGLVAFAFALSFVLWRKRIEISGSAPTLEWRNELGPFVRARQCVPATEVESVEVRSEKFVHEWALNPPQAWHWQFVVQIVMKSGQRLQIDKSSCGEAESEIAQAVAEYLGVPLEVSVDEDAVASSTPLSRWTNAIYLAVLAVSAGIVVFIRMKM